MNSVLESLLVSQEFQPTLLMLGFTDFFPFTGC